MNRIELRIQIDGNWEDLTPYILAPLKIANLLDEQLDEFSISLKNCPYEYFQPNSKVTLICVQEEMPPLSGDDAERLVRRSDEEWKQVALTSNFMRMEWLPANTDEDEGNYIGWGGRRDEEPTNQIEIQYQWSAVIASDNAIEEPVGSGRYTHELYLIEYTKIAEGFIGESLTFTNGLSANYSANINYTQQFATTAYTTTSTKPYTFFTAPAEIKSGTIESPQWNKTLLATYPIATTSGIGTTVLKKFRNLYPSLTFDDNVMNGWARSAETGKSYIVLPGYDMAPWEDNDQPFQSVTVVNKTTGQELYKKWLYFTEIKNESTKENEGYVITKERRNGVLVTDTTNNPSRAWLDISLVAITFNIDSTFVEVPTQSDIEVTYVFYSQVTGNRNAVKFTTTYTIQYKKLVSDVLGSEKWTITGVVDRLCDLIEPKKSGESNRFRLNETQRQKYSTVPAPEFSFTQMSFREQLQQVGGFIHAEPRIMSNGVIVFDEYGQKEKSHIAHRPYIAAGFKTNINEFCSGIDTSVDNLVNRLDYAQGVVYEPFQNGFITVRVESSTVQVKTDEATIIPTSLPIYEIVRVRVIKGFTTADITSTIYERSIYNSQLSSYQGLEVYPYSKGYALYYEQGQQNIKGLYFQLPAASGVSSPAIANILKAYGLTGTTFNLSDLMDIGFEIEYVPMYGARIKTAKQEPIVGAKRDIVYNQSENVIETRYFGQHLQGVAERLGNVEKNYTYILSYLSEIPKVGLKFDDNYYISAVSTEILPYSIQCTVGLSKNFNRVSSYVGVNSSKRMWEVSERQTQRRQTVIQDFLVISRENLGFSSNDGFWSSLHFDLNDFFAKFNDNYNHPVSHMEFSAYTSESSKISGETSLSVVSSAFGNSLLLTGELPDNYSAGQKIEQSGSAYYSNYVQYCNFYGNFYLMGCTISRIKDRDWSVSEGQNYPDNTTPTNDRIVIGEVQNNWVYRKDNREIPQFNFELTAVTRPLYRGETDHKLIIGTGLMKNSRLVTTTVKKAHLYLFKTPISMFEETKRVSTEKVAEIDWSIDGYSIVTGTNNYDFGTGYNSWAFITEPKDETITAIDVSTGEETTQTIQTGGELMVGGNIALPQRLYFTIRRKLDELR